jgi:hypothetical protein
MDSLLDAQEQEAIADSLMSAPVVGSWRDGVLSDTGETTTHDPQTDREPGGQERIDDWQQITDELRGEPERSQQPQAQPEAAEQAELSPAEIQQGIQQLSDTVEQLGLNDQEAAASLAYDLSVPFGSDPRSIDSQALGQTMAQAVLSAVQIAENGGENLGPVPLHAAQAFTGDFLRSLGVDPRTTQVDSQQFANVVISGLVNFIDTVKVHGVNASLDRLNSPEMCEWFAKGVLQSFGVTDPVTREYALHLADAGGKYILSVLRNLEQAQPQQRQSRQAGRQSQGSRAGSGRQKSNGAPRFKSNNDIFDDEAMNTCQLHHGRL